MAGTQKDEFWVKAQRIRIKEAFALFDKDKKGGTVGPEAISTLMRYLGAYPTEEAMTNDILPDMQEGDPSAPVPYPVFETKMLDIMASKAWDPDPPEVLLQAFRTIDEAGVGYIETTMMNELLMTKGTPFRAKEIEAFNSVAKDPETGHIYFEDYVTFLSMQT